MKSFMLTCALAMLALFGVSMAATNAYADPGTERAAGAHGATKDVVATAVEAGHFKTLVPCWDVCRCERPRAIAASYWDSNATDQAALFEVAHGFEQTMWMLHRFALLLPQA
jgi:hypothetical protein